MAQSFARVIPDTFDPLGEALYLMRLNGSLYCQSELTAPWAIDMPAMAGNMMFHIVLRGECWVTVGADSRHHLAAGSLALLTQGQGHSIASDCAQPTTNLFDIPITNVSERYEILRFGGGGEETLLACGVLSVDQLAAAKLIEQLPDIIHLPASETLANKHIESAVNMMALEASSLSAGGETIMTHLADIIVIQAIRHWLSRAPEASVGWLGALQDIKIGKAMAAIHQKPELPWTVDNLALEAGMSRSGFSARFNELIGISVKQYVTEWRMNVARARLKSDPVPLGQLAEELGYQSEAAFSRAYKRVMGESPVRHASAAQ
jgi:AraC-like DNA-binding protein